MAKPTFIKSLDQVLGYDTKTVKKVSAKGTEYESEIVPFIDLFIAGEPEKAFKNDEEGWRYPVADVSKKLNYSIKVIGPRIKVNFGQSVRFVAVTGGALGNNNAWFSAEKITKVPEK